MAGRRAAVQIEAARRLQNAAQFNKPRRPHRQIRHHVAGIEEGAKRLQNRGDASARFDHQLVRTRRVFVPLPSVLERMQLRRSLSSVAFGEQYFVGLSALERRGEIDPGGGLVGDVPPENVEVIAVEKMVHCLLTSALVSWELNSPRSGGFRAPRCATA